MTHTTTYTSTRVHEHMYPLTPTPDIPLGVPPGFLYLLDPLPAGWIDWLWQVIVPFLGG